MKNMKTAKQSDEENLREILSLYVPSDRTCECECGHLNCLTRKETSKYGSTVLNTGVQGRHHWKEKHPARFIPELPERYIQLFSHKGETVLDPFCGSGTTNVVAKGLARNSIGIDVNPRSAHMTIDRLQKAVSPSGEITKHLMITGDSAEMLKLFPEGAIDLIVTSPPYMDVKDYKHDHPAQLGNVHSYPDFLDAMTDIFSECQRVLKPDGFMVVNTQDYFSSTRTAPLHIGYVIRCLPLGFRLVNINIYILNYSSGGRLVFGYPKSYYPKNDHEFNLIFRKNHEV
jgi:DNA modification methylase